MMDTRQQACRAGLWPMLGLTAAALAARLFHLDYRGFWTDEFHTLDAILRPLPDLIMDRLHAGHLPTYFILLKLWTLVAGTSEWALRFPSAVAGAMLVPAVWLFARKSVSNGLLLALMSMAAFNGMAVWSSQEARMYSMLTVAATLSHYFYLRTMERGGWRTWTAYYFWLLIAVSLQPAMVAFYAGHAAFAMFAGRAFPRHRRAALAGAAVALTMGAIGGAVYVSINREMQFDGFHLPRIAILWGRASLVVFGSSPDAFWMRGVDEIMLLVCAIGGIIGWRKLRRSQADIDGQIGPYVFLKFCFYASIVPLCLMCVFGIFTLHIIGPGRYLLPASAPLWILALWGVAQYPVRTSHMMAFLIAVIVATGLGNQWYHRGSGAREAAIFLREQAAPGDPVFMRHSTIFPLILNYYGAAQVDICLIPYKASNDDVLRMIRERATGKTQSWIFEYRDQQKRLSRLAAESSESVTLMERYGFNEARVFQITTNN
ncbi:MAG: glycosyltransferase family 39 protein [bacterium]|nr:glycosyltransferase family 39 protein [Candidatus Sumerlaeota bacterium]